MSWRALVRGPMGAASARRPLSSAGTTPRLESSSEPLAQGGVLIEFVHHVSDRPENILRYRARDPGLAAFTLRLDPGGALALLMRQGDASLAVTLSLPPVHPGEEVRVSYHWRLGPEGGTEGLFVAALPLRGHWTCAAVPAAVVLNALDAARLNAGFAGGDTAGPRHATAGPGLVYAAVTDAPLAAGPLPGIDGRTPIATPGGPRPLSSLTAGDAVLAHDGAPAHVLWAGSAALPALGRLAPYVMRAPFYGLWHDMVLAGEARVHMTGTEVEYLFFQEEIAVAAADLDDQRAVARWPTAPVVTYHQVLLDRPALLSAGGAALPPFDAAPLLGDGTLRGWSMLADLPDGALPDTTMLAPRRAALRDYEAASLRRMRAA